MRVDVVLRYVGVVMIFIALFMLLSAGISYVSGMDSAFYPLLLSSLLTALLGAFPLIFVERTEQITNKEGFCVVVGSWLVACVVGTFPYLIWGGEFSLVNAWVDDPERCRGAAPRVAVLAFLDDLGRRYGRGDVRAADPALAGPQ